MAGNNSKFDDMARKAAERIEAAKAAGEQMTFLPDEPAPGDSARAKRGKGKATSQLRDWCASRGLRMPEDVLIEMAGMASTADALTEALARAERVLVWAQTGEPGSKPTLGQRLAVFQFVFTAQLRAAEALLPYGLGKVTPDVAVTAAVQVVMPGASAPPRGPETARDVTPKPGRIAPPPMPMHIEQNQGVSGSQSAVADGKSRTE